MNIASGQGLTCGEIQPFCAGDSTLIFQNSTNSGVAEVGPDYGCLFSQPNPVWYFIQINQPGDLFFEIIQNSQVDFLGTPIDVDFIAWGPFSNAEFQAGVCDNLTSDMQVPGSASEGDPPNITTSQGCSYNSAAIENFNIINAQAGEIYVLLITNFDNETGFIQLQQTNAGGGSTDCSIINTTHHCEGDVISLDATTNNAVIYEWFKDGNLLPETGPILNNVAAPSAIYTANAIDSSNNSIVDYEFIIEFHAVPIAATADNLLQCDDNNDGFWAFDLSVNDVIILGIQDATQFSITYYDSQANADSGSSILSIPFTNTSSLQTIYARIENNDNTNCFDTISFMIEMFDTPTPNTANNLLECDDDNDGFFVFDLSVNDALILDTQDATQFSITYHDSQADANSGNNSLATSHTNTTNAQTIFARIESNVNTNCFDTTSFTIEVFDTPTANVADDLLQCDDDNDGFFAFDLDQQTTNVLGTQDTTMFTVTYHQTQAEADININNLLSPYTNLTAYQEEEIFVRIENNFNNNCFDTSSFLIDVFDTPTANSIVDFEFCDNANDGDDTNGFVTFDLSTKINEVLGAQLITDFGVKFYFTQVEADAGLAGTEITTSIQNISNPQLIVARIENVLNVDCYDTTTFNLVVNPLPVITPLVELKQCDDDTDGFTEFNLTESNELISTNFLNQTFTYHILLTDAEGGLNAIPNEINYVNTDSSATPDILFVRIENADGCFRTSQLNLIVSTTQIPQNFQLNYFVCDDLTIDDDNTAYSSNIAQGNFNQEYFYASTGYNGKFSVNIAAEYQDYLYLGLNLNSHFINYNRSTFLFEENSNLGSLVSEVEFENNLSTIGTGFSFQLGGIAKLSDVIRVGLTYDSPIWYTISEETTQYLATVRDDNGSNVTEILNPLIINVFPDYKLQTPAKITGSLALVIDKQAIISFDYSRKDYGNTKFKPESDQLFSFQNNLISNSLKAANTYKIGGEYRHNNASFRAGYKLEESPYKDTNFYGDLKGFSLGFGYSFGNTKIDLAYENSNRTINSQLYNVGLTDAVRIDTDYSNFTLSLSLNL